MDGSMNLEQALEERLRIIDCTPRDIKAFIKVGGLALCSHCSRIAAFLPRSFVASAPVHCTPQSLSMHPQPLSNQTLQAHPPESRLVPGVKDLISALQARGVAVYLISGGFRWGGCWCGCA